MVKAQFNKSNTKLCLIPQQGQPWQGCLLSALCLELWLKVYPKQQGKRKVHRPKFWKGGNRGPLPRKPVILYLRPHEPLADTFLLVPLMRPTFHTASCGTQMNFTSYLYGELCPTPLKSEVHTELLTFTPSHVLPLLTEKIRAHPSSRLLGLDHQGWAHRGWAALFIEHVFTVRKASLS